MNLDHETLAAIFTARITLAKKTADEAAQEARVEHARTLVWIASDSHKEKSFRWFCDEFDLNPGAVRKAIEKSHA